MSVVDTLNEPVLILNVNFEPLHVTSTRRALILVLDGKAEIILNGRGVIHSIATTYEIPSIIKLEYMVRRPRVPINLNKREILRRDDHICQYCGKKTHFLTIDHVIPRRLGGQHTWINVVAACPTCNRHKGGKTPESAGMKLRRPPFEPNPTAYNRFSRHLTAHQEWEPFISGW